MTIATEIARLQGVKADILGAIAEKKVDVPTGAMLADAPDLIRSIKSGINVKIGQGVYPAVKIGNQLWLAKNLDEELGTLGVDEWYYNGRSEKTKIVGENVYNISSSHYAFSRFYDWETGAFQRTPPVKRSFFVHFRFKHSGDSTITLSCRLVGSSSTINDIEQTFTTESSISAPPNTEVVFNGVINELKSSITLLNRIDVLYQVNDIPIEITELRCFYGTTDQGNNTITVPEALANEATAKANNYGRLYNFENCKNNFSKLNLTDWHIPTNDDIAKLNDFCGGYQYTGKKLKSKLYGGTDDFGFNALMSGQYNPTSGFSLEGERIVFKSIRTPTIERYNVIRLTESSLFSGDTSTGLGMSLRLVMDLNEDGTIPDSNIVLDDVPATTAEPLALASEPIVEEE